MTQRKAVKYSGQITAECPLGGTCLHKDVKLGWIRCGHYDGAIRDKNGMRVYCRFADKR